MADSIQSKSSQKSYLRQVQQEQAQKKRELMVQQKDDMRALREYYAGEKKQVDDDSAAAINHIKSNSGNSQEDRAQRLQERADMQNQRQMEKDQMRAEKSTIRSPAAIAADDSISEEKNVDKKQLYNRQAKKAPMLQNYETKESDDFYRVQNRGSRVSENNQGYVIEAYAPEHEKDNLRVSIQRNKAVVSGQRKHADEAQEGNKTMRTNNFQTFREEFKFSRPVSHEGMTRERVGDFVRFTIPKLESTNEEGEV